MMSPFIYGRAVTPCEFYNRRGEVRRLLNRIEKSLSAAIVGLPLTGKTSLLHYVKGLPQNVKKPFGIDEWMAQSVLNYLDLQRLADDFDQPAFWQQALAPLIEQLTEGDIDEYYNEAEKDQFSSFALEKFFDALDQINWRLILLLDEFDILLSHPTLNNAQFYGTLRTLASRYTSLTLVIATCRSISQLNLLTQTLHFHGSPFFNFFTQIQLGSLPEKDAYALLAQAGDRFSDHDRKFIIEVSGNQPALLQLTADILWPVNLNGKASQARYQAAANEVYQQAKPHLAQTWQTWSTGERKAITAVALGQLHALIHDQQLNHSKELQDIANYTPELRTLLRQGMVEMKNGHWEIKPQILLWWLANQLKCVVRDESHFEQWLRSEEIDGLLTKQEREKLQCVAKKVNRALGKSRTTLITSFLKPFTPSVGIHTCYRQRQTFCGKWKKKTNKKRHVIKSQRMNCIIKPVFTLKKRGMFGRMQNAR